MDNPKVNLYIATTIHGPAQKGGRWMYLLEYTTADGRPATLHKIGEWMDCKETELALSALAAGLRRMKSPSEIRIFTSCRNIWSAIEREWLKDWIYTGWLTAKGKPVKHRELWEEIYFLSEQHLLLADTGGHTYQHWMQAELKKHNDSCG
ncbi:MAG: hypothetical protein J6D13_09855 [Clostridium sp.]|nr:hypothetical protein [Clostridium sp.]